MRADVILLTVEPSSGEGTYSFVCPSCDELVEKPADQKIVSLLMSVGVDVAEWAASSPQLEVRPGGPAFTLDDVIDFHFLLSTDGWMAELMASAE